jgi:hypothetical protein
MKIEHKIERQIDTDALTPEAILTFWKYSIGDYNLNDERTMRCMEVVLKSIELGLMKDEKIKTEAKILDKIMNEVTKIIDGIESHLESNSKFDSDLYCIDLSEIFDVSDDKLYSSIRQTLYELLDIRHLMPTYDHKKSTYTAGTGLSILTISLSRAK